MTRAFTVGPSQDAAMAFEVERAVGWPRTLAEVERRFEVARGFAARDASGEAVGVATLAVYDGADGKPGLAWVGGMAVREAWRGRGVGRALLEAALETASPARVVGLDATDAGRPLYARAGFVEAGRSSRWRRASGAPAPRASTRHSVHPISLSETMEIAEHDLARFGAKRIRALLSVMHANPWRAFMARDRRSGDVTGFVLGQERTIGPLVADDEDAAAALLAACELAGGAPVAFVPDANEAARRVLETAGWAGDDVGCTRMLRGGAMPGRASTVFAHHSWALG